ncbi:MAG: Holliday junction branch migration protein RuvA [Pseudomonadota bacterium]|nr:Holliday junction branch migration protein RuvA [Pseudomonadota bacterium]
MIAQLRGLLIAKHPPTLVIDVQGLGYEVQAPLSTCYQLPELNSDITLLTHLSIREDAHVLYGFLTEAERQLFRDLIRVTGIGPRLALNILSTLELPVFVHAVCEHDIKRLTRIPGVGKKMAERLVLELRDRLLNSPLLEEVHPPSNAGQLTSAVDDAISVLIALGYKAQEASEWVHAVSDDPSLNSETLIRRALQKAV